MSNISESVHANLLQQVDAHPFPIVFATVSGAHLYGFPSPDSDFDLRGVHCLPLRNVVGLKTAGETVEKSGVRDGMELDLVTHDLKKFVLLMLKPNGYVLEQLLSPIVIRTSATHQELISIAPTCVTKHHAHHYLGFSKTQWKLFAKEPTPRVKPLLYVFRVLLTGIHLMRTGIIESNLMQLNDEYKLPFIPNLVAQKREGPEKGKLAVSDLAHFEREYHRLTQELERQFELTTLGEANSGYEALNDLLIRARASR